MLESTLMKNATDFKRARQPEQIEQRRREILHAAANLMSERGLDQVSLNAIARRVGLAKSNVYRYFETREEIYLTLLRQDWSDWLADIELQAESLVGSNDINALSRLMADSIAKRDRMCELVSVMGSVLEQNLSESVILTFKSESLELGARILMLIRKVVPDLPPDCLRYLGHTLFALIAGLWPLGNPAPQVKSVISRPELAFFSIKFADALDNALNLMLKGASNSNNERLQ